MTKVLITGATGNVGMEVVKALQQMPQGLQLYAGVRDAATDWVQRLTGKPSNSLVQFIADNRKLLTA